MDSFGWLNDQHLPSKEDFYSILNDEQRTDEDYEHEKTVWDEFNLSKQWVSIMPYLNSDIHYLTHTHY